MSPVGFEPPVSAGERPQTYALDRAATGTGLRPITCYYNTRLPFTSTFVLCYIFKIVTVIRYMQRPQKEAPWIDYPDDFLFFVLLHLHLISLHSAPVV